MSRPAMGVLGVLCWTACGSEPPPAVEVRDVVGRWHISLTEPPTCGRNHPALALDLDIAVLGRTGVEVVTLQGRWGLAPLTNPSLDLVGTLDLRTGVFQADFIGTEPTRIARLEGTMGAYEVGLTGTLTDPAPAANPLFGSGSCSYAAAGRH